MKSWRGFKKTVTLLLVLVMLSSTGTPAFAKYAELPGGAGEEQTADENSGMMELLRDEYGDEQALEMHEILHKLGLINQDGEIERMPIQLDGKEYRLDEIKDLLDNSKTDLTQIARVDEQEISLESLKKIIDIEAKIAELEELQDTSDVHITKDHLNNLESLIDQAGNEGFSTISEAEMNTSDAGAEMQGDYEDETIVTVTEYKRHYGPQYHIQTYVDLTFKLNHPQDKEVSFSYELMDGALGSPSNIESEYKNGDVTFEPGETEKTIEIMMYTANIDNKSGTDLYRIDSINELAQKSWSGYSRADYIHFYDYHNLDDIHFDVKVEDDTPDNYLPIHKLFHHTYNGGAYLSYSIVAGHGMSAVPDILAYSKDKFGLNPDDKLEIVDVTAKEGDYTTGQIVPITVTYNNWVLHKTPKENPDNNPILKLKNGAEASPEIIAGYNNYPGLSMINGYQAVVEKGMTPEEITVEKSTGEGSASDYQYSGDKVHNDAKWDKPFSNDPEINFFPAQADAFTSLTVDKLSYKIGDTINFTIQLDHKELDKDGNTASDWIIDGGTTTEQLKKKLRLSIGDKEHGLVDLDWKKGEDGLRSETTLEGKMEVTEDTWDFVTGIHWADGALRAKIYYNQNIKSENEENEEDDTENFILLHDHFAPFQIEKAKYIEKDDLQIDYPDEWPSGEKNVVSLIVSEPTRLDFTYPEDATYTDDDQFEWKTSDESVATIQGDGTIVPKRAGIVKFKLIAKNGSSAREISIETDPIVITANGPAGLNIPSYSDLIRVEKNHAAQVLWSTNVMDKYEEQAAEGQEPEDANFTVELYEGNKKLEDLQGETPLETWKAPDMEELINATSFQIPGDQLGEVSKGSTPSYTVKVSTKNPNPNQNRKDFSAVAYIIVTSPEAVVKLDKSMGQFMTDDQGDILLSWTLQHFDLTNKGDFEFKVTKNGELIKDSLITFDADREEFDDSNVTERGGRYVLPIDKVERKNRAKDVYAITLKAKNGLDSTWSYDSLYLQVYKQGAFHIQVDGEDEESPYIMSNIPTIESKSSEEILGLKRKINLSHQVGINNDTYSDLSSITDQFAWESSRDDVASLFYRSGATIDNIRHFSMDSYQPKQQFKLGNLSDGSTTITAEHVNTGMESTLDLQVATLKDKLYLFQFFPKAKSTVTYTDKKGEEKEVETNDDGELALYDEDGIDSDVYVTSNHDGDTYTGVINQSNLKSQEGSAITGDLYPVNTLQMRQLAKVDVYFKKPDGEPYTGEVTYFGGVYKNGYFAEKTEIGDGKTETLGEDGKLEIDFDTTDFYSIEAGEEIGADLSAKDKLSFLIEAHFEGDEYYPQVYTLDGDTSPVDMVAIGDKISHLTENESGDPSVFAVNQYVQKNKDAIDRDYITDYKGRFGPSDQYPSIKLVTEFMWWGESVDEGASATLRNDAGSDTPAQSNETFQYPFSKWHTTRHVQVLNKDTIWLDKGDTGAIHFKLYDKPGHFLQSETTPATLANMIGIQKATPEELKTKLQEIKKEMTNASGEINGPDNNDNMTQQTLGLLENLNMHVGPLSMEIIPTTDPTLYKTFIKMDVGDFPSTDSDGLHVSYLDSAKNVTPGLIDMRDIYRSTYIEKQRKALEEGMKGIGSVDKNFSFGGYYVGEIKYNPDTGKWENIVQSGGFNAGGEFSYTQNWNALVGPVPVTFSLSLGGGAEVSFAANVQYDELHNLEWSHPEQESVNDYLTSLRINAYIEAFGGVGFDYSVIAAKIGFFGRIMIEDTNTWLNRNYLANGSDRVAYGNKLTLEGVTGVRAVLKFLFISFSYDFASLRYSHSWMFNHWEDIQDYWEDNSRKPLTAENVEQATLAYMKSIGEDPMQVINSQTLEKRDYLKEYKRVWHASGQSIDKMKNRALTKSSGLQADEASVPSVLQSNAYPYSNPEVADDGSIVVYLSDGESTNVEDTVASWMVRDGDQYNDQGNISSDSTDKGYGDTNLHVAGEGNLIAATWVRQQEKIDKEAGDDLTNEDIMLMNNSAEVMVSIYNGEKWETTQLTDNKTPDVAPVVSVNNGKVLVAYRSVSAGNINNPLDFSESDHIVYQVYDGDKHTWSEPETLYNGTQGHVMGLSTEMLSDGRAAVVYTLNQEDSNDNDSQASGNQIVYSVVNTEDEDTSETLNTWKTEGVIKNLQVTKDENANENPQLTRAKFQDGKERFILGWYLSTEKDGLTDSNIRLLAFDGDGEVDPDFEDSLSAIKGANKVNIDPNFTFARNAEANKTLDHLSIIWKDAETQIDEDKIISRDTLNAVKFGEDSDGLFISGALSLGTLPDYTEADSISAYVPNGSDYRVEALILGTTYTTDTETVGSIKPSSPADTGDAVPVEVSKTVSDIYTLSSNYKNKFNADDIVYNPEEIIPGFDLPIQFNVVNQGMSKIESVDIELGDQKTHEDELAQAPNETKSYTATYTVPETIKNIPYDVTVHFADESELSTSGEVTLDLPDVGVSEIQLLKEEDGHRRLSIPIYNKSHAGLDGKGRTVKFGLYEGTVFDKDHLIGNVHDIFDDDSLQLMNQGGYTYTYDFDVKKYLKATLKEDEIPSNGLNVFVHVWVEDDEGKEIKEYDSSNNSMKVIAENLATKYKSDSILLTTSLDNSKTGSVVTVDMQNMNMEEIDSGNVLVNLLDEDGKVIESKYIVTDADKLLRFGSEETKDATVSFEKTGQSVQVMFFREDPENLDASLSNVELEGIPLDFDAEKTTYSLDALDLKETTIMAMASNRDATVTLTDKEGNVLSEGTGSISFQQALERSQKGAPNHFKITVEPVGQAGEMKTYTFDVKNTKTNSPELAIQIEGVMQDNGKYKGGVKIGLTEYQVAGFEPEQAMVKVNEEDWKTIRYDGTKETYLATLSKAGSYEVSVKIKLESGGDTDLGSVTLEIDDYDWIKNDDGETITITGYNGTDKDVVIPDTLEGLTVTGIGDKAFAFNSLKGVTIPDSVTSIGEKAFASNSLKSVTIPDSVISIGDEAFVNNKITNVKIPNNITSIEYGVFGSNLLENIEIPKSVIRIEGKAFADNELTNVDIPDSITSIGDYAFESNKLASITIPENVTSIGEGALIDNKLTSVVIHNDSLKFGDGVFINNPSDLTIIGNLGSSSESYANDEGHNFAAFDSSPTVDIQYEGRSVSKSLSVDYQETGVLKATYGHDFADITKVIWTVNGKEEVTSDTLSLDSFTNTVGEKAINLTVETEYGGSATKEISLEVKPPIPDKPKEEPKDGSKGDRNAQPIKQTEEHSTDQEDETLPKTATNTFNFIVIGIVLLLLGGLTYFLYRRFKVKRLHE